MNTYVVGYISFFDNELKLKKVEATDEINAVINFFIQTDEIDLAEWVKNDLENQTMEQIKVEFFNTDSMVGVLKI